MGDQGRPSTTWQLWGKGKGKKREGGRDHQSWIKPASWGSWHRVSLPTDLYMPLCAPAISGWNTSTFPYLLRQIKRSDTSPLPMTSCFSVSVSRGFVWVHNTVTWDLYLTGLLTRLILEFIVGTSGMLSYDNMVLKTWTCNPLFCKITDFLTSILLHFNSQWNIFNICGSNSYWV